MIPVTLVVIAKAPVPGQAKTRLAVTVGEEAAWPSLFLKLTTWRSST